MIFARTASSLVFHAVKPLPQTGAFSNRYPYTLGPCNVLIIIQNDFLIGLPKRSVGDGIILAKKSESWS